MKANIHPQQHKVLAKCICTNEFYFDSALAVEVMHIEVCGKCHPFYTGKQQVITTTGRAESFNSKFTKFQDNQRNIPVQAVQPAKPKKGKKVEK